MYFHQVAWVNTQYLNRLVADFPLYVTQEWDSRVVSCFQKLQAHIFKLQTYASGMLETISDEAQELDLQLCLHDIRNPLAVLRLYCDLLKRLVPTHDPVLTLLEEIDYYVRDTYQAVDDFSFDPFHKTSVAAK